MLNLKVVMKARYRYFPYCTVLYFDRLTDLHVLLRLTALSEVVFPYWSIQKLHTQMLYDTYSMIHTCMYEWKHSYIHPCIHPYIHTSKHMVVCCAAQEYGAHTNNMSILTRRTMYSLLFYSINALQCTSTEGLQQHELQP